MKLILAVLASYLVGSFPAAFLVARRFGHLDVFEQGSRNPGTSNIYRLMGLRWASLVLTVDLFKGYLPARLAGEFFGFLQIPPWFAQRGEIMVMVGVGAVLGHLYPVFTRFHGGKGVATLGGVLLALAPLASTATLLVWIVVLKWKKAFSVASLSAAVVFPVALYFLEGGRELTLLGWGLIVPLLLLLTHHENLRRLFHDEELPMRKHRDL